MHLYNGLVLLLIFVGVSLHRHRKIHVPIMVSCFMLDMASVLYLELARGVFQDAIERISNTFMQVHLTFAILTLVGYGVALYTGRKLLKGGNIYMIHRTNAAIFLCARSGIFITSFFVHAH